jgi:hypothetical protein
MHAIWIVGALVMWTFPVGTDAVLDQPANTWVKRSPLKGGPRSPELGYEASFGYDPVAKRVIRWAGHNQGGGGEQNAETWTFDPVTSRWELKEPNLSPPGVCCAQQNVFDPVGGRFLRFQGFSGNHGWQWFREIYLNNTAVWSYDLARNTWRDMRAVPAPRLGPLRCASWDSHHQVVVIFGGENISEGTIVYDPYDNSFKRMQPKIQPAFRSAGNMAYDEHARRHVLFGAQFTDDPHTWAYDLAKNEWIDLKPEAQPPTDRNDAVLAYDPNSRKVIASLRAIDATAGKEVAKGHYETWAYDSAANTWTRMSPPTEPPGGGNRRRIMVAVPEQNVIIMENYVNPPQKIPGVEREQQIWTYRFGTATAPLVRPKVAREKPRMVEDVIATVHSPTKVALTWTPPAQEPLTYHVERAVVEVYSEDQIVRLRKDTVPLAEPSVGAVKAIGEFVRITKAPLASPAFVDESIDLARPAGIEGKPIHVRTMRDDQLHADGKPYRFAVYAYRVRAINGRGVESGAGPYALTIPSSPQWLFSKEDGDKCHLKWAANAEKGLKGYRVYRMESPRINGPGQPVTRLTAEPLVEPRFLDEAAGKVTRRYWVVAVDALGQEGFPSAPTWHWRQYRSYYVPFTGEWHQ